MATKYLSFHLDLKIVFENISKQKTQPSHFTELSTRIALMKFDK
jgi:hypothetical protein